MGSDLMRRADALAAVYDDLAQDDVLVVTIMGAVAVELYQLGHRPSFFYLEHAMGLASSLGLGLALSLPAARVVVVDGDGSLLMNLGTLSTLARYRPTNLTHVVFDNETLLSVGGFPTATATGTDLAGIARAAGVPAVVRADTVGEFVWAARAALEANELTTIVAKVAPVGPTSFHMDLPLLENRFQFQRHCRRFAARAAAE
jgi:sulfopyruvate decarboxylase subunit beta